MSSAKSAAGRPNVQPAYVEPELDLGRLIGQKSRVLRTKLEILALEMATRFHIRDRNVAGIDENKAQVEEAIANLDRMARYHLREHHEKTIFYRNLFELEVERRRQEADCWRDLAMVMKDFLYAWEGFEQARARLGFFENVGQ